MNQVTLDQVFAAIKTVWVAGGMSATVTGGLHEGVAPDATVPPYATLTGSLKSRARFSAAAIQVFTLTVKLWVARSSTAAGTLLRSIEALLDDGATALVITGATVMDLLPVGQTQEKDPVRRDSEDLVASSRTWDLWLDVR